VNTSLYRSAHALAALAFAVGFAVWARWLGQPLGWARGNDRAFLLASGWTVLALYFVLWAYAVRKGAHRTRASFEFARAVPLPRLERAQERLSDLRVDVFAGRLTDRGTILLRARRVLAEEKVDGVLAVGVIPRAEGQPANLEVAWRTPLGSLARWLHAHVYYGFAAAALLGLHGGMRWTSPMAALLNGLSVAVLATGFVGLLLWTFGPRWLSRAERDLNLERASALRPYYAQKVEALAQELRPLAPAAVEALRTGGEPALAAALEALGPEPAARGRDLAVLVAQARRVEATWRRLARRHLALHAWRFVHVPLSIVLLLVVAVHVVSVLFY